MNSSKRDKIIDHIVWDLIGIHSETTSIEQGKRAIRHMIESVNAPIIGISSALREARLSQPKSKAEKEHVIPIATIADMLINRKILNKQSVDEIITRHLKMIEVTPSEHVKLNKKHKSVMPVNWDNKDILARYKASDVAVILF